MGFDWGLGVSVEFVQQVDVPASLCRFVKRLLHWHPPLHTTATARKPSTGKMRKVAVRPLPAEDDSDDEDLSDVESEHMDVERAELCKLILDLAQYEEGDFDLLYNYPERAKKAFVLAADKLLGVGHDLVLCLEHGGCNYEHTKAPAVDQCVYIAYKPSITLAGGSMDPPRGGVNAPWGVKITPLKKLSVEQEASARAAMARVCAAFGLKPTGECGLALVTVASGG